MSDEKDKPTETAKAASTAIQPARWLSEARVPVSILRDPDRFEFTQRIARLYSESQLVPAHLRGKLSDCFIALNMADTMGEDPLMVMQNIYIINGKAGWSAQYMIARANRSGMFKGPLRWRTEGAGDTLKVWCFADLAGVETDARIEIPVSMQMAKDDGWTRNEKYKSIPEQMLRWRSATWLVRLYCPEVMMGLPSVDELVDTRGNVAAEWGDAMQDVTPPRPLPEEPRRRHRKAAPAAEATSPGNGAAVPAELPYLFADVYGQIHEFKHPAEAVAAYTPYLDAARGNAQHIEAVWQNGAPLIAALREYGQAEAADALVRYHRTLVDEVEKPSENPPETSRETIRPAQEALSAAWQEAAPPPKTAPENYSETSPPPPPAERPDNPLEYDVVVPLTEGQPINQWHMHARNKLKAMHDAQRPQGDFIRFREANKVAMARLHGELRSWHNMIVKEIDRGAAAP